MNIKNLFYCLGGLGIFGLTSAAVAFAPGPGLSLLDSLERGSWQLRSTSGVSPVGKICLGDPRWLTQLQHVGADCERYVVRSSANSVTVSYSCEAQGLGLTTIRKESNRIIHIQSQGIRNNAPFSFAVEGRKTGPC